MPIKHTWVFFDQLGATWTENYWLGSGFGTARASLVAITPEFINLRLAYLWKGCKLRTIRASEKDGGRTSDFRNFNLSGLKGGTTGTPDVTGNAAIYRLVGSGGSSRFIWFRGNTDDAITRNPISGVDIMSGLGDEQVKAFVAAAGLFGYGVLSRKKPSDVGNLDYRQILTIDGVQGNGTTILVVSNGAGYVKNAYVSVSKVDQKRVPGMKGLFKILEADGNSISVAYRTPANQAFATVGGRIRLYTPNDVEKFDPTRTEFDHAGGRQTKSLFTRSRGAQSAQRIRNLV